MKAVICRRRKPSDGKDAEHSINSPFLFLGKKSSWSAIESGTHITRGSSNSSSTRALVRPLLPSPSEFMVHVGRVGECKSLGEGCLSRSSLCRWTPKDLPVVLAPREANGSPSSFEMDDTTTAEEYISQVRRMFMLTRSSSVPGLFTMSKWARAADLPPVQPALQPPTVCSTLYQACSPKPLS